MALPVVTVAAGGLPINRLSVHGGLPVTLAAQGLAVTEAAPGCGLPVTYVTEGGSIVLPPDTTAPTITSANTVSNAENSVLAHALTANESVTWSIVGGADAARFEISGSTLRWAGNGTKDFEAPNDADTNNQYVVQVRATDTASNTTNQTVTVTVTDTADVTYATFNGTPAVGIVLSNGNRTVQHGTTNNGAGVQSLTTLSSGKYYFEMTLQTSFSLNEGFGIKTNPGGTFTEGTGVAPNGVGVSYGTATTKIYTNSVDSGKALGITAVNDVFGAAIDLTARLVWFRRNNGLWNGTAGADPATGVGGVAVPAGALSPYVRFTNSGATDVQAANFGQSAFAFTPPSGFTAGWPS